MNSQFWHFFPDMKDSLYFQAMQYSSCAVSDVGLCRQNNEDSFLAVDEPEVPKRGQLYAVADGMGGYAAGETASRMVCELLEQKVNEGIDALLLKGELDDDVIRFLLEKVVYDIHKEVFQAGRRDPELNGMGSTLSLMYLYGTKAYLGQVGDSRIYRFRNGLLEQLTEDQTEVQRYVKMGRLSAEEAETHHLRHVLSQAIGGRENSFMGAVTSVVEVLPEDIFLICSDGLYDMVRDALIEQTFRETSYDSHGSVQKLLQYAIEAGGKDNVTLLLVKARVSATRQVLEKVLKSSFASTVVKSIRKVF